MRWIYTLLVATLLSLPSCKTYQVSTTPIEVQAPDSMPDPFPPTGWKFLRTSPLGGVYVPEQQPVIGKVKNSYNTDSYNKKSHNTETKQKDVANTKAKGEAIIGDANAPIQAKKQAVVGEGNTVEQKSGWPWWVWVPLIGLLLFLYWIGRKFTFK